MSDGMRSRLSYSPDPFHTPPPPTILERWNVVQLKLMKMRKHREHTFSLSNRNSWIIPRGTIKITFFLVVSRAAASVASGGFDESSRRDRWQCVLDAPPSFAIDEVSAVPELIQSPRRWVRAEFMMKKFVWWFLWDSGDSWLKFYLSETFKSREFSSGWSEKAAERRQLINLASCYTTSALWCSGFNERCAFLLFASPLRYIRKVLGDKKCFQGNCTSRWKAFQSGTEKFECIWNFINRFTGSSVFWGKSRRKSTYQPSENVFGVNTAYSWRFIWFASSAKPTDFLPRPSSGRINQRHFHFQRFSSFPDTKKEAASQIFGRTRQ